LFLSFEEYSLHLISQESPIPPKTPKLKKSG